MQRAFALAAVVGATSFLMVPRAIAQELIDFTKLPAYPAENVRPGSMVVEDYPLPAVDNAGAASFDHSISLAFERMLDAPTDGRAAFKTATFTYPLDMTKFNFPKQGYEISLWIHVDGSPAIVPGASPFTSGEVRPEMVRIQISGQGKTFTSARQRVSRGWNELRFCLTSKVNLPRNSADFNNRVVQFSPEDESGTTIDRIKLIFDGTFDCSGSYAVGKIRLNTCKLQPIRPCSIVMVYDDSWSGFYDLVFPTLKTLQMPATLAVVKDYTAPTPYHMSLDQLKTVFDHSYFNKLGARTYLFDLVNHTKTHARLHNDGQGQGPHRNYRTSGSSIGVYDDILEGRKFLIDKGLIRGGSENFLIYPGGASDAQVYLAMEQIGIKFGRVVSCERNQNSQSDSMRNPYAGETYDAAQAENNWDTYQSSHPLDELFDWIDEGIATGRSRFIMWHDILPLLPAFDATGRAEDGYHTVYNSNSLAFHDQVIAYIQSKRSINCVVRTLPNWYFSLSDLQRAPGFHF